MLYAAPSKSKAIFDLQSVGVTKHEINRIAELYDFVRILVPQHVSRRKVRLNELPELWHQSHDFSATRQLGDLWVQERQTCLLEVPSATSAGESNFLLNPEHPDFEHLQPVIEPYGSFESYDSSDPATKNVFICHASEDKADVVRPLHRALFELGISCWLDEIELTIGDSISARINEGLRRAQYVLVLISPAFLRKNWPQRELEASISREAREGKKVILPVVIHYPNEKVDFPTSFPLLEDKLYLTWDDNATHAAAEIAKSLRS